MVFLVVETMSVKQVYDGISLLLVWWVIYVDFPDHVEDLGVYLIFVIDYGPQIY